MKELYNVLSGKLGEHLQHHKNPARCRELKSELQVLKLNVNKFLHYKQQDSTG